MSLLTPHTFICLGKVMVGHIHQMRAQKSYLTGHTSWSRVYDVKHLPPMWWHARRLQPRHPQLLITCSSQGLPPLRPVSRGSCLPSLQWQRPPTGFSHLHTDCCYQLSTRHVPLPLTLCSLDSIALLPNFAPILVVLILPHVACIGFLMW